MPGPKRKPAALKLIEGIREGRDSGGRVVQEAPNFDRRAPIAPTWLPDEARAEWDRVVPELDRIGVLKSIDAAALASYCMAWDRFVEASAIVAAEGLIVGNEKTGAISRHPALLTAEAASKEIRAWAGEFGLTPSAEARLATSKGEDGDQGNPFASPSRSA
ncbi:MAG TPA: phage terminase small subunit P27 family [Trebonia sp.]